MAVDSESMPCLTRMVEPGPALEVRQPSEVAVQSEAAATSVVSDLELGLHRRHHREWAWQRLQRLQRLQQEV